MHAQNNLALTELKELLKKRKYKTVLAKIERILEQLDNEYYSLENLISFLLLQTSAINKILQRNLLKKYKYEPKLVEDLIGLLTRNLDEIHLLLIEILDINIETISLRSRQTTSITFSLVSQPQQQRNIRIQKLNTKSQKRKATHLHRYIRKFIALASISTINTIQMMLIYRKQINSQKLEAWTNTLGAFSFPSPTELVSQSKMLLLLGKLLSVEGGGLMVRSQTVIEQGIDTLIDAIRLTNRASARGSIGERKTKKYESIHRECYKLMIIALVISNKNNMRLQREEVATLGCNLIKTYVQNLSNNRFNLFKRLMQPEIYIQEQFLRYREEKQELCEVVAKYFVELKLRVAGVNEDRLSSQNRWILQTGDRTDKQFRCSGKQKPILQDISTSKSILTTTKVKGNNSITSNRNNSKESLTVSKEMRDNILANMIVTHIEDINHKYSRIQKNIARETYRRTTPKTAGVGTLARGKVLKRQKLGQTVQEQPQLDIADKFRRLQRAEENEKENIKAQKQKLRRRVRYNPIEQEPQIPVLPAACELSNDLYNNRPIFNLRTSDEREQEQEQTEFKHKVSNLTSKSKLFLQILFMNKNGLGIRKIVEKFQMIKKREEEKQKLLSNRMTSSFHRERDHIHSNSLFKLHIITQAILRKHINGYQDDTPGQSPTIEERIIHRQKKAIEASYTLGQDSIEAVKGKLIRKMSGKERVVDQSERKEEAFKQKLKRLGSNNFFLKRVAEKNQERQDWTDTSKSMTKNIDREGI